MEKQIRKEIRLKEYDYCSYGCYFITICTDNRKILFWDGFNSLSSMGKIADKAIQELPKHYPTVKIDKYVVMPDHVHILMMVENIAADKAPSVSRIIQQLKGIITKQSGFTVWQKSYYDHVVRNEREYQEIWQYIDSNPRNLLLTGKDELPEFCR